MMVRSLRAHLLTMVTLAACCATAPPPTNARVDVAPAADLYIVAEMLPGTNIANDTFCVGCNSQSNKMRALLRFDLSAVPADATVTAATLEISVLRARTRNNEVRVFSILEPWGAAPAGASEGPTWGKRSAQLGEWRAPGGTLAAAPSGSVVMDGPARYAIDAASLTADVQRWIRDPSSNHGWALVGDETRAPTVKRIASSRHEDEASRPRLVVSYVCP